MANPVTPHILTQGVTNPDVMAPSRSSASSSTTTTQSSDGTTHYYKTVDGQKIEISYAEYQQYQSEQQHFQDLIAGQHWSVAASDFGGSGAFEGFKQYLSSQTGHTLDELSTGKYNLEPNVMKAIIEFQSNIHLYTPTDYTALLAAQTAGNPIVFGSLQTGQSEFINPQTGLIYSTNPSSPNYGNLQAVSRILGASTQLIEPSTQTYQAGDKYYTLSGNILNEVIKTPTGFMSVDTTPHLPLGTGKSIDYSLIYTPQELQYLSLPTKNLTPSQMWEKTVLSSETGLQTNPFTGEVYKMVPSTGITEQQRFAMNFAQDFNKLPIWERLSLGVGTLTTPSFGELSTSVIGRTLNINLGVHSPEYIVGSELYRQMNMPKETLGQTILRRGYETYWEGIGREPALALLGEAGGAVLGEALPYLGGAEGWLVRNAIPIKGIVGGIFVASEGLKVSEETKSNVPISLIGFNLARDIFDIEVVSESVKQGVRQGFGPKFTGMEGHQASEFTEKNVLDYYQKGGEPTFSNRFPSTSASSKELIEMFKSNPYSLNAAQIVNANYILEQVEPSLSYVSKEAQTLNLLLHGKDILSVWSATAGYPTGAFEVIGAGSSESPGLSASTQISPNFLRLFQQSTEESYGAVGTGAGAKALSINVEDVVRIPEEIRSQGLNAMNEYLTNAANKMNAYVAPSFEVGKPEIEVKIPPGARTGNLVDNFWGFNKYVEFNLGFMKSVKIPIAELALIESGGEAVESASRGMIDITNPSSIGNWLSLSGRESSIISTVASPFFVSSSKSLSSSRLSRASLVSFPSTSLRLSSSRKASPLSVPSRISTPSYPSNIKSPLSSPIALSEPMSYSQPSTTSYPSPISPPEIPRTPRKEGIIIKAADERFKPKLMLPKSLSELYRKRSYPLKSPQEIEKTLAKVLKGM
jgi:hypothetical protein